MLSRTKFAGPVPHCGVRRSGNHVESSPGGAAVLLVTLAVLISAPTMAASAPSRDGDNPGVSSGILSTPITAGRGLNGSFALTTLADSNFRRTSDASSAIRLTPLLSLGAGLPVGRQQLFIGGDLGRDYILNNSRFNAARWSLGGGAQWSLGTRCSGVLGAEYSSRLNQVFEQAEFTNNVQNRSTYAGSASCQTSGGLGAGVTVIHRDIKNERPQRFLLNLKTTSFAPNIFYGSQKLGQFSLGATIANTSYPLRFTPTLDGVVGDGLTIFSGRVGYSRGIGSRLQIAAGASYLKSTPKPRTQLVLGPAGQIISVPRGDFSGGGFDLSVNYRASDRLGFNVLASRDAHVSANVGALFIVTEAYTANATYSLSSRIDLTAGGSRLSNSYRNTITSPDEPFRRVSDRITRVFAQLDYSPVPLYSVGLVVSHQWRVSNPANFDFNSTSARVRLTVNFGRNR